MIESSVYGRQPLSVTERFHISHSSFFWLRLAPTGGTFGLSLLARVCRHSSFAAGLRPASSRAAVFCSLRRGSQTRPSFLPVLLVSLGFECSTSLWSIRTFRSPDSCSILQVV